MNSGNEWRERFPEYAKYYDKASAGVSQQIGNFIEWLGWSDYVICSWTGEPKIDVSMEIVGGYHQADYRNIEHLLCMYYEIDYDKAMREREEYLRELLSMTSGSSDVL